MAGAAARAAPLSESEVATLREVRPVKTWTQPTDEALRLVVSIAREKDIERIKSVLDLNLPDLASVLCAQYEFYGPVLPPPLETSFVERYDNPAHQRFLSCIVGKHMAPDGGRQPKYQTRALFDKLSRPCWKDALS